jgi:hypothetical protein
MLYPLSYEGGGWRLLGRKPFEPGRSGGVPGPATDAARPMWAVAAFADCVRGFGRAEVALVSGVSSL